MRPLEVKAKTSSPPPRACDRLRMPSLEPPDLASHRCKVFLVHALRPTYTPRILAHEGGRARESTGRPFIESKGLTCDTHLSYE